MFLRILTLILAVIVLTISPVSGEERERGWIGAQLTNVERPAGDEGGQTPAGGVRIVKIVRDSPASQAGLRAGDVVLTRDGAPVESVSGLIKAIGESGPGSWLTFTIDRRGKERDIRLHLETRPANIGELEMREGWIGIDSIGLPPSLRVHFGAPEKAGVMISEVIEGGPGYIAGLELGDVVYLVDDREVRSARHLDALLRGGGIGNLLEISLMRSGVEIVVEATVVEEPRDGE